MAQFGTNAESLLYLQECINDLQVILSPFFPDNFESDFADFNSWEVFENFRFHPKISELEKSVIWKGHFASLSKKNIPKVILQMSDILKTKTGNLLPQKYSKLISQSDRLFLLKRATCPVLVSSSTRPRRPSKDHLIFIFKKISKNFGLWLATVEF